MIFFKKLTLILLIFFGCCLETAFSNTMQAEYSYSLQNEYIGRCDGKINRDQLFLNAKDYLQYNHIYRIPCQDLNIEEILPRWLDLEDESALSLNQDISKEKFPLSKEISINHQENKVTPKFLPQFLLKSSFLL